MLRSSGRDALYAVVRGAEVGAAIMAVPAVLGGMLMYFMIAIYPPIALRIRDFLIAGAAVAGLDLCGAIIGSLATGLIWLIRRPAPDVERASDGFSKRL